MINSRKIRLISLFVCLVFFSSCRPEEYQVETYFAEDNLEEKIHFVSHEDIFIEKIKDQIFDPSSKYIIVNKEYSLNEDYIPEDLVALEVPTIFEDPEINQLREEVADMLKKMFKAAETEDITLYSRSGYRSYRTQVHLFNRYASNQDEEDANLHGARPGESEHQTGLAVDITSESVVYKLVEEFSSTREYNWVKENAHEYGFIIRYPKDKEEITGYMYEPWHLRYLGEELATYIFKSGLSYEEYLEKGGCDV